MKILLLSVGAVSGALLRYWLSGIVVTKKLAVMPIGTVIVNISGCFVFGMLLAFMEKFEVISEVRTMLFIGLLGSYTTFSSFAFEAFEMMRQKEILFSAVYVLISVIGGLLFFIAGYFLIKLILRGVA